MKKVWVTGESHYIPHYPVIRNNKSTTKVRIVFDASASSNSPSFNSCLCKGPQLTPLMFDIPLRSRSHFYALVGYTEKAFHPISIIPQNRNYLRFL